eukprot:2474374-Pyramimonas_sp.AAC.1
MLRWNHEQAAFSDAEMMRSRQSWCSSSAQCFQTPPHRFTSSTASSSKRLESWPSTSATFQLTNSLKGVLPKCTEPCEICEPLRTKAGSKSLRELCRYIVFAQLGTAHPRHQGQPR